MKITQTLKNFNKKRVRQLRLSEESETTQQEQSCCFVFCTNTQTNSDLKFYKFPDGKKDGDQATKWLMAIQTANGRWWRQRPQSAVCAEHFVSGAPSRAPADVDYAPSIFPKDSSALCKAPTSTDSQPRSRASFVAAAYVLGALVAGARAESSLCSSQLYRRVIRELRIGVNVGTLHAAWVGAQRAALLQVRAAGRRGDRAGEEPPPFAARLADLVLLHTDVDGHRLLDPASEWRDEEYRALGTLCRLVRRCGAEVEGRQGVKVAGRGLRGAELELRWSLVHAGYRASGRAASVIVLQRRWHELKLQAREASALSHLHRAVLRQHPHVASQRCEPRAWTQLVLDGDVLKHPLPLPAGPGPGDDVPDDAVLDDPLPDDLPPPGDRPPDELPRGDVMEGNSLPVDTQPHANLTMTGNTMSAQPDNSVKIEITLESSPSDHVKLEPSDPCEKEGTSLEGEDPWQSHSQAGASETEHSSTLQLLQSLDPSAMQTEILYYDSDEDFESHGLEDKVEVELAESMRELIKFEEDLAESDVTRPKVEDEEGGSIDPKLVMDARVLLERLPLDRLPLVWSTMGCTSRSSSMHRAGSRSRPKAGSSSRLKARSSAGSTTESSSQSTAESNSRPTAESSSRPTAESSSGPTAESRPEMSAERGWRRVQLPESARGAGRGGRGGHGAPTAAVRPMCVAAHTRTEPDDNAAPATKRRRSEAGCDMPGALTAPPTATVPTSTSISSSASTSSSTSTSSTADAGAEHRRAARRRLCQLYATFAALLPESITSIPNIKPPQPSRSARKRSRASSPPATSKSTPAPTDTTLLTTKITPETRKNTPVNNESPPSKCTPERRKSTLLTNESTSVPSKSRNIKCEGMSTPTKATPGTNTSCRANSTISNIPETSESTPVRSNSMKIHKNENTSTSRNSTPVKVEETPALNTKLTDTVPRVDSKSTPVSSNSATLIGSTVTIGISVFSPPTPTSTHAPGILDGTPTCSASTVTSEPKSVTSTRPHTAPPGTSPLKPGVSLLKPLQRDTAATTAARAPPAADVTRLAGYEEWQRQKAANAKYFNINTSTNVKKRAPPPSTTASLSTLPAGPPIPAETLLTIDAPLTTGASSTTGALLTSKAPLSSETPLQTFAPLPTGASLPPGASLLPGAPLLIRAPLQTGAPPVTPLPSETVIRSMTPLQALAPLLAPGQPAPVVVVIQNTINNVYGATPGPPGPRARGTNMLRHGDYIEISDSD